MTPSDQLVRQGKRTNDYQNASDVNDQQPAAKKMYAKSIRKSKPSQKIHDNIKNAEIL